MATLNEAPEQLKSWINELNGQIGMLTEQRDMLASTLAILDGSAFDDAPAPPKNVGGRPRAALTPDEALEARRASDRERKKNQRRGIKAPPKPGAGGTSKYDYAEVASVARAAHDRGEPMGQAVATRFGATPVMGSWLVREARRRGHDIPGRQSKPTNVTPLLPVADIETVGHPAAGPRAFTPADTLKLLQGG